MSLVLNRLILKFAVERGFTQLTFYFYLQDPVNLELLRTIYTKEREFHLLYLIFLFDLENENHFMRMKKQELHLTFFETSQINKIWILENLEAFLEDYPELTAYLLSLLHQEYPFIEDEHTVVLDIEEIYNRKLFFLLEKQNQHSIFLAISLCLLIEKNLSQKHLVEILKKFYQNELFFLQ